MQGTVNVAVGIRNVGGLAVEDCLENLEDLLSFGKCLILSPPLLILILNV